MRLIFHWSARADFAGEVRLQMKGGISKASRTFINLEYVGSRDPYNVNGAGAGFVFAWQGSPRLLIGHENDDKELIQVKSESMVIAVPE
jgi:hypothetical protein